jgi:subtilisin family serine protease
MDGRKSASLVFSLLFFALFLSACENKKTVQDVADYNSQSVACPYGEYATNKFIVSYEDGRIEVVNAESTDLLEKNFIEPRLNEIKRVEYDSKVRISPSVKLDDSSVQTQSSSDWGPAIIEADSAWNEGIYGEGIKVAVIDAAVDITHKQIIPRLSKNTAEISGSSGLDDDQNGYTDDIFGWDFYRKSPNAVVNPPAPNKSPNVHGTHVAGIILADHSKGDVWGVAPKAELLPVNFMDDEGGGSISDAIPAIKYAVDRGAKIINASWGGPGCSTILNDAITEAGSRGTLFVTAAGNDGIDFDRVHPSYYQYPAVFNIESQITVAATTTTDLIAAFSNKSYSMVHIAAPGDSIRSTVPTFAASSGAGYLSGTSMAAPFVSGTAALLWSIKPNATVAQIKQALLSSVDSGPFKVSTRGRLNVQKAVDEIRRIVP